MSVWADLKNVAQRMRHDVLTVYFVARDSRTPLLLRVLAYAIAAYGLSPIDLIPDFIPILGHLDEILLLVFAVRWILRHAPNNVLRDSRMQASLLTEKISSRGAAMVVLAIWLVCAGMLVFWLLRS